MAGIDFSVSSSHPKNQAKTIIKDYAFHLSGMVVFALSKTAVIADVFD
jgi:hypothetical protein